MSSNAKITSQFEIKFYTKDQFDKLTDVEFKIPNVDFKEKLSMDYAIGEVRYNQNEDGVIIYWNPIVDNSMSKLLGKHLLTHDNTSLAIFSSLINYLQQQFYSNILFEESFRLNRIANEYDENNMDVDNHEICPNDNLSNTIILKHSTRKELKYLYGKIVLPLIYYIFTLKSKIDVNILNTFYNEQIYENQDHIDDINNAAAEAPNEEEIPTVPISSTSQNAAYGGYAFNFNKPNLEDDYQSDSSLSIFNSTTPIEESKVFNIGEDTIMKEEYKVDKSKITKIPSSIEGDDYKTKIKKISSSIEDDNDKSKIVKIIPSSSEDNTTQIRNKKRKTTPKNSKTKRIRKKLLFDFDSKDSEDTSLEHSDYTADEYDNDEESNNGDNISSLTLSRTNDGAAPSEMSSIFRREFNNLSIDQESMLKKLNLFYEQTFRPIEESDRLDLIVEWELIKLMFSNFMKSKQVSLSSIKNMKAMILSKYGAIEKKEYYAEIYSLAQRDEIYGILVLYTYLDMHAPKVLK